MPSMSAEQRMQGLGDADGDGVLHADELRAYSRSLLQGDALSSAQSEAFSDPGGRASAEGRIASEAAHLARLDANSDGKISHDEFHARWRTKVRDSTPTDVVDWLTHAVLLPQHAERFRLHAVDFEGLRALAEDPGSLSDPDELNVSSRLDRDRIKRAIDRMFADVGSTPGAPTALEASLAASALARAPAEGSASAPGEARGADNGSGAGGVAASCSSARFFKLRWSAPTAAGEAPTHGYRLSRRVVFANTTMSGVSSGSGSGSGGNGEERDDGTAGFRAPVADADGDEDDGAWLFSQRITGRAALVSIPRAARGVGGAIHVRVQAWNFVGSSAWSDVATFDVPPPAATLTSGGVAAGECGGPSSLVDAAEGTGVEVAKFYSSTFSASGAESERERVPESESERRGWMSWLWYDVAANIQSMSTLLGMVFAGVHVFRNWRTSSTVAAAQSDVAEFLSSDAAKNSAQAISTAVAPTPPATPVDVANSADLESRASVSELKTHQSGLTGVCSVCRVDKSVAPVRQLCICKTCGQSFCRSSKKSERCGHSSAACFAIGHQGVTSECVCFNCKPDESMPGPELPHLIVCKVAERVDGDRRDEGSESFHGDREPKRYQLRAEQQRAGTYISNVEKADTRDDRGAGASAYVLRLKRREVVPIRKGNLVPGVSHKDIKRLDGGRSPRWAKAKANGEEEKFRAGNFVKFKSRIGVVKSCKVYSSRKVYDIEEYVDRALDDLVLSTEDAALRDAWYDELVRLYGIEGEGGRESDDAAAAAAAAEGWGERGSAAGGASAVASAERAGALSPPLLHLSIKPDAKVLVAQGAHFKKKQKQSLGRRVFGGRVELRYIYIDDKAQASGRARTSKGPRRSISQTLRIESRGKAGVSPRIRASSRQRPASLNLGKRRSDDVKGRGGGSGSGKRGTAGVSPRIRASSRQRPASLNLGKRRSDEVKGSGGGSGSRK